MTRLLCPDGCEDKKDGKPATFMNVQTLRMHLLHIGGRDDKHPERTQSQIERLIFNPDLLPENNIESVPGKKTIKIRKGGN